MNNDRSTFSTMFPFSSGAQNDGHPVPERYFSFERFGRLVDAAYAGGGQDRLLDAVSLDFYDPYFGDYVDLKLPTVLGLRRQQPSQADQQNQHPNRRSVAHENPLLISQVQTGRVKLSCGRNSSPV